MFFSGQFFQQMPHELQLLPACSSNPNNREADDSALPKKFTNRDLPLILSVVFFPSKSDTLISSTFSSDSAISLQANSSGKDITNVNGIARISSTITG